MRLRVRYEALRRLVRAGVFTVGRFSTATKKPPVFLRVKELEAWKRGGVEAVGRLRREEATAEVVPAHEYGEAGA
jgi:hypothetical protein